MGKYVWSEQVPNCLFNAEILFTTSPTSDYFLFEYFLWFKNIPSTFEQLKLIESSYSYEGKIYSCLNFSKGLSSVPGSYIEWIQTFYVNNPWHFGGVYFSQWLTPQCNPGHPLVDKCQVIRSFLTLDITFIMWYINVQYRTIRLGY